MWFSAPDLSHTIHQLTLSRGEISTIQHLWKAQIKLYRKPEKVKIQVCWASLHKAVQSICPGLNKSRPAMNQEMACHWRCNKSLTEPMITNFTDVYASSFLYSLMHAHREGKCIWVMSRNCGCLVTWFCYQLIAKPGNKTAAVSWPEPYSMKILTWDMFYSVRSKYNFINNFQ